jgi:hypothetical protein
VSLDDAINAARYEADRRSQAQAADDEAKRDSAAEAADLAAQAVARLAELGDEMFVRVRRVRLLQPSQYLDYIGARYRADMSLRCWTVLPRSADHAPVLLLADGTLGRFRPPAVPLQRTRAGRRTGTEFISTEDPDPIGDSADPFLEPYGSYLEAVRQRLAAAIVRYERHSTRANAG